MTNWLLNKCIKGIDRDSAAYRAAAGQLTGVVGIGCNLLLVAAKLVVGILAGSVSVLADAANNLSDISTSVVTLLGFRFARHPADREHPYGHGRAEYLAALFVGILIILVGLGFGKSAVERMIAPETMEFQTVTVIILGLSSALKLWMMAFCRGVDRTVQSQALQAMAADSRNDALGTLAVAAGYAVSALTPVNVDGLVGLVVCGCVIWSGYQVTRDAASSLLGKQADQELRERVLALLTDEKILGVHDLLIHEYGYGQYFATAHLEIASDLDVYQSHLLADDLERCVLEKTGVHLVIHCDPVETQDAEQRQLQSVVENTLRKHFPGLSYHDFRLLHEEPKRACFDLSVPHGMKLDRAELETRLHRKFRKYGDYVVEITYDED